MSMFLKTYYYQLECFYNLQVHFFQARKIAYFIYGFAAKVTCAFLACKKQWKNYQNYSLFKSEETMNAVEN